MPTLLSVSMLIFQAAHPHMGDLAMNTRCYVQLKLGLPPHFRPVILLEAKRGDRRELVEHRNNKNSACGLEDANVNFEHAAQ